jgi:NADH-quinone oxidoreductase subunit N
MTLGAFAVLSSMSEGDEPRENYSDFAGLGFKRPFLALAMSCSMLSLARISTARRLHRKILRLSAQPCSQVILTLAVIGVLNSLLSVIFTTFEFIVAMYMEEGGAGRQTIRCKRPMFMSRFSSPLLGRSYLGILPSAALDWSRIAFASLE